MKKAKKKEEEGNERKEKATLRLSQGWETRCLWCRMICL